MPLQVLTELRCLPHSVDEFQQPEHQTTCTEGAVYLSDDWRGLSVLCRSYCLAECQETNDEGLHIQDCRMNEVRAVHREMAHKPVSKRYDAQDMDAAATKSLHSSYPAYQLAISSKHPDRLYGLLLTKSGQQIPGYTRGSFCASWGIGPSAVTSSADGISVSGIIPQI